MRLRLKTPDGVLGWAELADGVDLVDVVDAMRRHRLFIVPDETTLRAPDPKPRDVVPGGQVAPLKRAAERAQTRSRRK